MEVTSNELTLRSPNGKYKIVLSAQDNGCAIWMTNGNSASGSNMVSIWNGFDQGVAVAVQGEEKITTGYNVALHVVDGDGQIQLVDKLGNTRSIKSSEIYS